MAKAKLFSVGIKQCEVQTFRCGGNGGQNVNKVESGVRIIHHPSGSIGQSTDTRDQFRNKRLAFARMASTEKFKMWVRMESSRLMGQPSVEEIVERQMDQVNLRVDIKDEKGRWVCEGS